MGCNWDILADSKPDQLVPEGVLIAPKLCSLIPRDVVSVKCVNSYKGLSIELRNCLLKVCCH